MIVADSSALVAVVLGEPAADELAAALVADSVAVSAATVTQTRIVIERRTGPEWIDQLERLLTEVGADVVPYTGDHAVVAHAAWRRFGKGRHPAKLNFGDCMAYATAKLAGLPLLFNGDDFTQTDIASAL